MVSLISIYTGGVLTLFMAIFHTRFYRMFNWKSAFGKLNARDSRVLYSIHLALSLLFFAIGGLSLIYACELSRSAGLAFGLNIALSAFWIWRLIWQLTYFKSSKGRRQPAINIILIVVFFLLAIAYMIPPVLAAI
ncbi:MAG: hypothetical protein ABFD12_13450 [Syntrophorhabdus sp.]